MRWGTFRWNESSSTLGPARRPKPICFDLWSGKNGSANSLTELWWRSQWAEAIVATNISTELNIHAQRTNAGVVSGADSTLRMRSSGRVRLPDVAFVSFERVPKNAEPIPTLAPDLAVEVLSESNTAEEINQKLREYFESGTRLAWIVDPATKSVSVYHGPAEPTRVLSEADHLDGENVLPGFSMPVANAFLNAPASAARR